MDAHDVRRVRIDADLADAAIEQVRCWLVQSRDEPVDPAAQRLADVLKDPHGLAFTVGFVDGVIRPEDPRAAARHLRTLTSLVPRFLPWPMRAAVHAGAAAAGRVAPWLVVPIARTVLRRMVRHLVIDATDRRLGPAIRRIRAEQDGARLNINLLGEAILGQNEAARRMEHGSPKVYADGPTESPHRYRAEDDRSLCLWYPSDGPDRKWQPADGLVQLIGMIETHLFKEAYWRETGEWLGEEGPHGEPVVRDEDAERKAA